MGFPPGLTTRGASMEDRWLVAEMLLAADLVDQGEQGLDADDIAATWQHPGFDPSLDVLLVFNGDRLVGYAEAPGWRTDGRVHPEARGRGLGGALLMWIEERALQRAAPGEEVRVGQTIVDGNAGATELLWAHGYEATHTSWVLHLGDDLPRCDPPAGVEIRPFRPGVEDEAIFRLVEDAFNEWPNRSPSSYGTWAAEVTRRPGFDPGLLLVAVEEEELVGSTFGIVYPDIGWVQQLAVRADRSRRGIAKALLTEVFAALRARGASRRGLSTDSRTGALDLYLTLGMGIHLSYTHYSKVLRPGGS